LYVIEPVIGVYPPARVAVSVTAVPTVTEEEDSAVVIEGDPCTKTQSDSGVLPFAAVGVGEDVV
jgi:hypothetical protein